MLITVICFSFYCNSKINISFYLLERESKKGTTEKERRGKGREKRGEERRYCERHGDRKQGSTYCNFIHKHRKAKLIEKSQWFLSNNKTSSLWESLDNVFNHKYGHFTKTMELIYCFPLILLSVNACTKHRRNRSYDMD